MILTSKKKQLIPFLMVGFPTLEASHILADMFIQEGCTTLEVGVPYSDPLADGIAIQAAAAHALKNQVTLKTVLNFVRVLKNKYPHVSFVLFTYLNPLLKYGLETLIPDAAAAGITATLTVDLPLEESDHYRALHQQHHLKTVFLVSPTTSAVRRKKLAAATTGFIYYVSRAGVTGTQESISTSLEKEILILKSVTDKPIAVGFGISSAAQVKIVGRYADAVVIGSRFIQIIHEHAHFDDALTIARKLVQDCLHALDDAQGER